MLNRIIMTGVLLAAIVLAGCHEYRVQVEVTPDGAGSRTVELITDEPLAAVDRHVLALDGPGWSDAAFADGDRTRHRHRRHWTVGDLDGWRDAGGLLMRGTADGAVRLVTDVQVEQVHSSNGIGHVYRETLRWNGLREALSAHVGDRYSAWLGQEFPALPDSLVHELRGVMTAVVHVGWADLTEAEGHEGGVERLAAEVLRLIGDRLLRAGVSPETAGEVTVATDAWDIFDGIEETLPGLAACLESSLELTVVMPGPVTDGNADTITGDTATFRVDLNRTLAAPVVLEVTSAP